VGTTPVIWWAVFENGDTASCTQLITVLGSPLAVNDSASTPMNVAVVVDVLANDIDCDHNLDPSTVVVINPPSHGSVSIDPITGEATYTPDSAYYGPDQFDYQVCDSNAACTIATVLIDVTFVSNARLAIAKAVSQVVPMSDGSFNITYIVTAENQGNEVLYNVQLTDDLNTTFPLPATFTIAEPPYSNSSLMSNTNFNGKTDINLLDDQASFLNIGETATVTFTVNVVVYGAPQTFLNLAMGHANNISGITVGDTSNNGYLCQIDVTEATPVLLTPAGLNIPQGFSPDGDGINDRFVIPGIEEYPDNEFTVFNRWGDKVFYMKGYDNSWDGTPSAGLMNIGRDKLVQGTYFYILEYHKDEKKAVNGFIVIKY
jgi:gliding motility-associated-like protein